jgi:hypothetical protein
MATVQVVYRWPDGAQLVASVQTKHSYPDALDQARAEAVRTFKEAWAEVVAEPVPEIDGA